MHLIASGVCTKLVHHYSDYPMGVHSVLSWYKLCYICFLGTWTKHIDKGVSMNPASRSSRFPILNPTPVLAWKTRLWGWPVQGRRPAPSRGTSPGECFCRGHETQPCYPWEEGRTVARALSPAKACVFLSGGYAQEVGVILLVRRELDNPGLLYKITIC